MDNGKRRKVNTITQRVCSIGGGLDANLFPEKIIVVLLSH